ncbi:hypothetical protein [Flavobacterium sp. 3HN19-14]|uniref:hypothetical protein n=1 Tax=Flavobacterium sp. 3HN19-14 TaxID=3448133 RepID=UPI003EE40D2F
MVKITGEVSSQDIPDGMITYNFNTQLHKVTIQNNTELTYPVSGTYTYVLNRQSVLSMCQSTINVNNEGTYCFSQTGNSMSFDLSAVDGLKLDFER